MEKRNVKIHGFIFNKLCKGGKMEAALEAGKKQFDLKRSAVDHAYQSARKAYIKSGDDPFSGLWNRAGAGLKTHSVNSWN